MDVFEIEPYYDPYDLWTTSFGQEVRNGFYKGKLLSKFMAAGIASCELFIPEFTRNILNTKKSLHPISVSQYILIAYENSWINESNALETLCLLKEQAAVNSENSFAFGLGFTWVSKNGTYSSQQPFVTHTPYAMEALLKLSSFESVNIISLALFNKTWGFLESLKVMFDDDDKLALSYAPVSEPRIVVNANSYAAYSYALHSIHGHPERRSTANDKAISILNWIVSCQESNGSWLYYADNEPGNFIDCFHSCFVVKNLIKVKELLSINSTKLDAAINNSIRYIIDNFYQSNVGLVKRFSVQDIKDPYKYILYDQAEFIGVLIDSGNVDFALEVSSKVEAEFKVNNIYYAQIDLFGRRVGENYMRWGIIPYLYQLSRLNSLRCSICVV
ncbi:hypothetical protein [Shewanella sp. OMA3-2]|uniref:hypothetical protein n=1 Tax=Shewanella sp. OMA3-2 TaxID=2908650 RepID=UPI001F255A76|nr:hypothetical protein [Shewanella sp. OMA3-2]UJF23372.1 hypothetical protein L0B17_08755 [Shewanella sp. OMA3-2]